MLILKLQQLELFFSDRDETVSYDLPITFANTGFAKMYSMPKVGQPVKCSFLGTGLEDGFIDGSFYNSENLPPTTDPALHMVGFEDGTTIIYDEKTKAISISASGGVNINGLNIGPDGTLTLANGVVVDTHIHQQDSDSDGNTEQPTGGPE